MRHLKHFLARAAPWKIQKSLHSRLEASKQRFKEEGEEEEGEVKIRK